MLVYLITNEVNGKLYVGKTERALEQRWKEHLSYANDPIMLVSYAIKKHGANSFTIRSLEECHDAVQLSEREKHWIAELGTHVSLGKGYNATMGGDGITGYRHTDDAKRRMGDSRKGPRNHNYGKAWGKKVLTDEERKALSETMKGKNLGKKHTFEARQKISKAQFKVVVQMDMEFNVLATYPSMLEAEKVTGVLKQGISACCRGVRNHAGSFVWKYKANA